MTSAPHSERAVSEVVASELPRDRSTLLVRLMAGGPLLPAATADLGALPADAHEHAVASQILLGFRNVVGSKPDRANEEQELMPRKTKSAKQPTTFETAREIALALPKAEEYTCYGTPAFRAGGKLFARLKEDGDSLVLKIGFDAKEILLQADPEVFYTTDHYNGYPMLLVRLSKVSPDALKKLLEDAYRFSAPKRLVAALG
jgi:hypothetical protein